MELSHLKKSKGDLYKLKQKAKNVPIVLLSVITKGIFEEEKYANDSKWSYSIVLKLPWETGKRKPTQGRTVSRGSVAESPGVWGCTGPEIRGGVQ